MLRKANVFLKASDLEARSTTWIDSIRRTAQSFHTFPNVRRQAGKDGDKQAAIHDGDGEGVSTIDAHPAQSERRESTPDITTNQIPNNVSTTIQEAF